MTATHSTNKNSQIDVCVHLYFHYNNILVTFSFNNEENIHDYVILRILV